MPFLFLFYPKAPIDPTCSPSSCFPLRADEAARQKYVSSHVEETPRNPDQACAGGADSPRGKAPKLWES